MFILSFLSCFFIVILEFIVYRFLTSCCKRFRRFENWNLKVLIFDSKNFVVL